jgi:uncharacterized protein (DUF433 family)
MTYRGTVRNGVVVFERGQRPPAEGTAVRIEPLPAAAGPGASEANGVYKNPRVSGGDACVGNTRIPVWTLVAYRDGGRADDDLLRDFPSLTAADLRAAWAYATEHPEEIREAIAAQERD